uniref:Uncharacterized protein n=1 Tax=Tanacetum cinerariifolium TaxID=118510 RepID=A0A699HDZ0_TANCI|nr:hypothetical protein [Tanacetum cinerariifolium]
MLYYESTYTLIALSHVMSTLAHSDLETISQTDEARSSRVPTPLPDDPYMAVRQAYLATIMDSESEPFEDFKEIEIPQLLPIASSPVLSLYDPYLIVGQAHTPAAIDTESELEEAPSETEELQPLAARTTPPSSNQTPTSPDPTPVEESKAEGTDLEREESEDEGPNSEGEEAAPKGQQRQASMVEVTTADRPLGLGYCVARCRALEIAEEIVPSTFEIGQSSMSMPDRHVTDETLTPRIPAHTTWIDPEDGIVYLDIKIDPLSRAPVQTPASPEWSSGSLPVSPASLTVPSPVASPVTTPTATIAVDEDEFLEVGAQLELHGSILHDHAQRLNALPPILLEGHGRDMTEFFDKSRVVKKKIHSQCFRLGSLERA